MIIVRCRINGVLARFEVDTDNHATAIEAVKGDLLRNHDVSRGPVLAVIDGTATARHSTGQGAA